MGERLPHRKPRAEQPFAVWLGRLLPPQAYFGQKLVDYGPPAD